MRLRICTWLAAAAAAAALGCGAEPADDLVPADAEEGEVVVAYDPARFDAMAEGLLKSYVQVQDALAHDRFEPAHAALAALVEHSDGEMQPLAVAAAEAEDLAGLRRAFGPLSQQLVDTKLPSGFALAVCPMAFDNAGGRWVQAEGEIMNPYFGSTMLHCGVLIDRTDGGG